MTRLHTKTTVRIYRFRKLIRAPLPFVFRWCTDYREDDSRITDSIYHYQARIAFREPGRIVRIISLPGRNRNRNTDVEIITLRPPNRWHLTKYSVTNDEAGDYWLTLRGPRLTLLEMRFRQKWKIGRLPDRKRYELLFNKVWDRYVDTIEIAFLRGGKP